MLEKFSQQIMADLPKDWVKEAPPLITVAVTSLGHLFWTKNKKNLRDMEFCLNV